MKKLENGSLVNAPRNEIVRINGVLIGISNFDKYLEENKDVANSLNYYEYESVGQPLYDEKTQYLTRTYAIIDNKIKDIWEINERPLKEKIKKKLNIRGIICKILPSWVKKIIWKVVVG